MGLSDLRLINVLTDEGDPYWGNLQTRFTDWQKQTQFPKRCVFEKTIDNGQSPKTYSFIFPLCLQ
jgi:hypothetical protein